MSMDSLWGEEFSIPDEKENVKKVKEKINKAKKVKPVKIEKQIKSTKISLSDKLAIIKENVLKVLSKQKDKVIVIKDKQTLHDYITKCIDVGRIDIDTETNNSLDPITCKLMGPCLYSPGLKQAYIPLNHRNPETKERLSWQLKEEDVAEELKRVIDSNTFTVFHNGKFDYQVIKCTCKLALPINWDTMIGWKIIDENEYSVGLKQLYIKYIDPEQEKYSIDNLFDGVEYADVDPEIFAYYAATDAFMTDKLFEYEMAILNKPENARLLKLLNEVEIPCITVTAEMELQGVQIDQEYAKRLQNKYHAKLDALDAEIKDMLLSLKPQIDAWKLTDDAKAIQKKKQTLKQYERARLGSGYNPDDWTNIDGQWYKVSKSKLDQLDDELTPSSLGSPQQLGIILYDILGCPHVNEEKPYATGEDELQKLSAYTPLCELMLKKRELDKLINAFIDSLPEKVNVDGRIHGHFNQYGAATGRFSSSEPNLQQIPSHNKEIRMLFRAQPGYILIGSDFSQQEPRLLSQFSQDKNMINAYKQGKDLYATIATGVYHNKYEDNLEHYPDGSLNAEGKKRRSNCKSLLLGIMYGRGVNSIAEQIKGTPAEAQGIIDNFYKSFPDVKKWMDESEAFAKENGYVEDLWGRRRRLPDIKLPKYTVRYKKDSPQSILDIDFNPFFGCENRKTSSTLIETYEKELAKAHSRIQYENIKNKALKDGIEIINNGGFISTAQRQCVNARIQGSAATMTKKAMIKIYNDKELKDLGFRLEIGVHDELIGECPVENAERVAELLTTDMKTCAQDAVSVPFKCDADLSYNWYFNDYMSVVKQEYEQLLKGDAKTSPLSEKEAFEELSKNHVELTLDNLKEVIYRDFSKTSDDEWEEELKTLSV